MTRHWFDVLSQGVAGRVSRRTAFRSAAALAASATATGAGTHAAAHQATPAATPVSQADGEAPSFLFTQTFTSGTWAPKSGDPDTYTLTLSGGPDQTIYFSDRPERIVGTMPMQDFLDGLGFTPENPPNAALVTQTDEGQDVLVIELMNPEWDESTATLTYDARVLEDYQEQGLQYLAEQQDDYEMAESFASASVFIDDCADEGVFCLTPAGMVACESFNGFTAGFCWHKWLLRCLPCGDITQRCNEMFPDTCHGKCVGWTNQEMMDNCIAPPG